LSLKVELDVGKLFKIGVIKTRTIISKFNIGHLLLISLALHLFVMCFPNDGGMVFDEVHYVKATEAHLQGIGANAEHSPLVKVFMSFMFRIFGDYWFTWRFPIVISCILTMLAFYYVAEYFLGERYALLATAFLSLDTVFFIHGTIYLLDMPAIMFGIGSIALWLKGKHKWSAVTMALALLCKEIALFFLFALVVYVLYENRDKLRRTHEKKRQLKRFFSIPLTFVLLTGAITLSGLWIYDAAYTIPSNVTVSNTIHNNVVLNESQVPITTEVWTEINTYTSYITNPIEHIQLMLTYHGTLMTNLNSSIYGFEKPWNWIFPAGLNEILVHPTYFAVKVQAGDKIFYPINYQAQATLPIWYSVWMVLPMAIYQLLRREDKKLSVMLLAWFVSTYGGFTILELMKHSTGFNYYFIYTVPMLCLGIANFWKNVRNEKFRLAGMSFHLFATFLFFLWYFPIGVIR